MNSTSASGPLVGLRVLDFSWGMPGGLATMILSDFGAEVIKVEPPGGDPFRGHPAWVMWNRGKKGIVLDLKTGEGREHARRLAQGADVLLEAFRPGVAGGLGIGYEDLRGNNLGLIYCSISGFGQRGPLAQVKGYEGVVAARAGRMMTFEDQVPRPGPVFSAVPVASWAASQAAIHGILVALRLRERTGAGQWVQTSLLQGTIPYDTQGFMVRQFTRMFPDRFEGDPIVSLRRVATLQYLPARCKDGRWIQLANNNFRLFQSTIRAMGLWQIYSDERFKNAPDLTPENREALREIILKRMQERTLEEWMQTFIEDGDVAAEPFLDAQGGMGHTQFLHNGHAIEIDDPQAGPMTQVGLLAHLAGTPGAVQGPAPRLGEHTAAVLGGLPSQSEKATRRPARQPIRSGRGEVPRFLTSSLPHFPLEGITVLEFATVIAGPYSASLLADLGARVIKVEPPGGDLMRQLSGGLGGGAVKTTAGKESIEIDMKTPEGLDLAHKLIARADVLLHNFRPGVPERLGMDYQAATAINPRLVYVYAAGYGSTGPHSLRPAFHPLPGALFGGVLRQAGSATPPPPNQDLTIDQVREVSRRLFRANEVNPDYNASMAITTAILLALHARERTGKGQEVEVTMLMANAYANADEAYCYEGRPPTAMPDSDCFGLNARYRLYQAREGWVFLACPAPDEWASFCRLVDRPDLFEFAEDISLQETLAGVFRERTAEEWEQLLTQAGVPCVRADRTVAEFFDEDPHPRANGLVVTASHQRFGEYQRYGPLVQFSDGETRHGPGVLRGQHTRPLLAELGYAAHTIEDLLARGVVFQEAP